MVLTVLIICTVFYIYIQRNDSADSYSPATEEPQQEHVLPSFPTINMSDIGVIDDYTAITERPLFNSDRRPFVQEQTEPVKSVKKIESPVKAAAQIELNAIIITDDSRSALLKTKSDKKSIRVYLGDNFEGWTVKEINSHSVLLESGDESSLLELESNASDREKASPAIEFPPNQNMPPDAPERPDNKLQAKNVPVFSVSKTYALNGLAS